MGIMGSLQEFGENQNLHAVTSSFQEIFPAIMPIFGVHCSCFATFSLDKYDFKLCTRVALNVVLKIGISFELEVI